MRLSGRRAWHDGPVLADQRLDTQSRVKRSWAPREVPGAHELTASARQVDIDEACDGDHGGAGVQRGEFACRP